LYLCIFWKNQDISDDTLKNQTKSHPSYQQVDNYEPPKKWIFVGHQEADTVQEWLIPIRLRWAIDGLIASQLKHLHVFAIPAIDGD